MKTKESISNFVKENKKIIITLGGTILISAITGRFIYRKGFSKGAEIAAIVSFEETIKWFDREIPGNELMALWLKWAKEHPDKIKTINF